MSTKWTTYTVARIRNQTPRRLVAEAFDPRFKRYLHRPCVVAWLERAEGFLSTHPQLGKKMALKAPELTQRACRERGLCDPELELRAWTVRGSMLRALGDFTRSEEAFRSGLALDFGTTPEEAWTLTGYSLLKSVQGRHTDALNLANRALTLLRNSPDPRVGTCDRLSLPCALVVKGIVLGFAGAPLEEESACFLEALRLATKETPDSKKTAAHNLAVKSVRGLLEGEPVDVDELLRWCGSLHQRLAEQGERLSSYSRCRLRWLEAQALAWKAGLTRQAQRYFASARTSLLKNGAKYEVVLLNLDLGYWLCQEQQWQRLERLAAATLELARIAGYQAEELAALHQWSRALTKKSGQLAAFREVYRVVRGASGLPDSSPQTAPRSSRWASDIGW